MPYMRSGSPTTKAFSPLGYKVLGGKVVKTYDTDSAGGSSGSSSTGDFNSDVSAITDAMKSTQASASADRQAALKAISDARTQALAEYGNLSPDVISQKTQEMMIGKARDTAEAQRASALRNLQSGYYKGSMPSGAAIQKASDIDLATMGTIASSRRDIMTDAAKTNWQGAFDVASAKAGLQTSLVPETVSVLGNTIATVPELGKTTQATTTIDNTYGRQEGESNIDFLRRDPEGYKKWYDSKYGTKKI